MQDGVAPDEPRRDGGQQGWTIGNLMAGRFERDFYSSPCCLVHSPVGRGALESGIDRAKGDAAMTFSAPLTGPMAGMLFFGDRDLAPGLEHAFKGSSSVHYEGTIYFPTTDVLFTGNGSGTSPSPYSFFIARRFGFNGNGEITINANYEASTVPIPPRVGAERQGLVR